MVVVVYGLQMAKNLLVPFLLAAFIALIAVRPMLWMQSKRIPAVLAALVIVTVIMLILTVVGTIVGRSIADFTAALPGYQQRFDALVEGALTFAVNNLNLDPEIRSLGDMIEPGWAVGLVANVLNAVRGVITQTFLIFLTVIFILLEASSVGTKVKAAFGSISTLDRAKEFLSNLGRYLGIKTVVSMCTGLLAGLLTWAIGLDFPLLWGLVAFLLNYVPTIGSIIAAIPPVMLALVQLGVPEAIGTMTGFVLINIAFGNFIEPRLLGYGVGISPLIVFVGLFFWNWVFGPVGMLLSVPLTMTLKLALESDQSTHWIAMLLGSERDAHHALESRIAANGETEKDQATSTSS